jgi:phospholipid/cholesterol/gamma-HCH transport system ATP-binding protein
MTTPVIAVHDLETRFGRRTVHRGLDLEVRRGEILAIVGGSGSGKTTLLRQILMLEQPYRGEIRLFGQSTHTLRAAAAHALWTRMGVMFQQGALFTALTVLENVCLPIREHARLSAGLLRELALLKIRLVGLPPEAAALYPEELSGGMTKRAAIARALALDPELLFLDEPTSGLDPVGAAAFDDLILHLKQLLNLTVVMVTHDPDSLWRTADRVAFLGEGRVLAIGPVAMVAAQPHPEIQRYFSGPRVLRARERTTWKAE